jgi:hypothetical protein
MVVSSAAESVLPESGRGGALQNGTQNRAIPTAPIPMADGRDRSDKNHFTISLSGENRGSSRVEPSRHGLPEQGSRKLRMRRWLNHSEQQYAMGWSRSGQVTL